MNIILEISVVILVICVFFIDAYDEFLVSRKLLSYNPYIVRVENEEIFMNQLNNEEKNFHEETELNLRPIIGILSQDLSHTMSMNDQLKNYTSYIAASYVKFVEAAGARVVPIRIDQHDEYYKMLANSLNGFLFPGGSLPVNSESGYGRTGKKIFDLVIKGGLEGKPLTLWATCLGFEMLMYLTSGKPATSECHATNMASNLHFQPEFGKDEYNKYRIAINAKSSPDSK